MSPSSQSQYAEFNIGNPSKPSHAVNLGYLTQELRDEAATKGSIDIPAGDSITLSVSDGVYLITSCSKEHRGLAIGYVCEDVYTRTIESLVGWALSGVTGTKNVIRLTNSTNTIATVYITAIGANSAPL